MLAVTVSGHVVPVPATAAVVVATTVAAVYAYMSGTSFIHTHNM